VWTMRFGDSIENRCKWFNDLGVMRKWLYIEKGAKEKIPVKNNMVNRLTKYMDRFRQLKHKSRGYEYAMKIDTHQTKNELIQETKYEGWNDSLTRQRVSLIRFKQIWIDLVVIRLKNSWNDSPQVRDFWWYDSNLCESIQRLGKRVLHAKMVCKTQGTHETQWDMDYWVL
jgi:hypothetical protein